MSLAPDWTVPPDVSPFTPLPLVERCAHCPAVLGPFDAMAVVTCDHTIHRPLCRPCATTLTERSAHATP